MKLKLVNKKKDNLTFEIDGSAPAYVNTLRRVFMTEVPTMAISEVDFKQNNSVLYDEIIAHRLGLLAIKSDLKSYNIPKEGEEEGAATHLKMILKATGPKIVTASDIKSKDPKVSPIHNDTPIVKLLDNQELEFVATAHLGFGKDHSKWNTGLVSYYYKPKITVNNKSANLKDVIKKFPPQIVKKGEIDASKICTAEIIDACTGVDEDVVKIEYANPCTSFVFTIESWGQLTPEEIVEEGINQYNNQLDEFEKLIKDA
ncbi:DNA-directed RNA polymerase subunit D [Candidatus Woesearchaeota archaeon]|nr:DNA-directed RNA polymerase subunit D [Candidatus Woesearchaeota archaeon]MCF7901634.1 DNA-directed RNA polymerase subunit D [Candidatus Woesearchaeota archaeon]MCF8012988.1 DNA-directed RNA polymerase subunit D [Candidatus Woesearchaeota archaeon]